MDSMAPTHRGQHYLHLLISFDTSILSDSTAHSHTHIYILNFISRVWIHILSYWLV